MYFSGLQAEPRRHSRHGSSSAQVCSSKIWFEKQENRLTAVVYNMEGSVRGGGGGGEQPILQNVKRTEISSNSNTRTDVFFF